MTVNGENVYYERGITASLYEKLIWDDIVEFEADWEKYDIVIMKLKDDPWNKAYYGGSDDLRKRLTKEAPEVIDLINMDPITDEEREYEQYDLDKIGKTTTYMTLFKKLGSFFREVDIAFHTSFYTELESLKKIEEEERRLAKEREALEEMSKDKQEDKTEKKIESKGC